MINHRIIPKGAIFGWSNHGSGMVNRLKALEAIPIHRAGEIALSEWAVEVIDSDIALHHAVLRIAVWEFEYSVN